MHSKIKIIAFMNAYTQGMSGGDLRWIEIGRRLINIDKSVEIDIVTSELGKKISEEYGFKGANYKITSRETEVKKIILVYLRRILTALKFNSIKYNNNYKVILYSTSDFLPDVIPAFFWKMKNKNFKWIALLHLIAPSPFYGYKQYYLKNKKLRLPTINIILYKVSQLLSIKLMKWKADKVFVINSEIKNYLHKKGISKDKVLIVNNGIDYNEIQKVLPFEEEKYDGLYMGRFHSQKGIFDLISIWKIVCKNIPNAKLGIVGQGDIKYTNRLRRFINTNGLKDNIELLGIKLRTEKISFLKSSKIFLYPSYYESFAIVIAEAMACGLPVVAYDLPVYQEIYEEGILKIPLGDVNTFAKTVINLLYNKELCRDIGLRGQKFIKKYDWNTIAERELAILKYVI